MTNRIIVTLSFAILGSVLVSPAAAQQPVRPDQPGAVSLTLAEYNRLLNLASRAPAAL